jgi:hypothetical protein
MPDDAKPYAMLPPSQDSRSHRWYPHEALEAVAHSLSPISSTSDLPWDTLRQEDAAAHVPQLKEALAGAHRFVAMIEAIADGRRPAECTVCRSHFYPSRADARYCSGRCRTRSHRGRDGADITPKRMNAIDIHAIT